MRIIILLLGLIVMGTGCGPQQAITIRFWHILEPEFQPLLGKHIAGFTKQNPNVTIQPFYKSFEDDLEKMLNYGQGLESRMPEVFMIPHDRLGSLVEKKVVQAISYPAGMKERIRPKVLKAMSYKDQYYGFPLISESLLLYYNTNLITTPPDTIEELLSYKTRFNQPKAGKFLITIPLDIPYYTLPWVRAFGGRVMDDQGRITLARPGNGRAFERCRKLFVEQLNLPFLEKNRAVSLFKKGMAPFLVEGPWRIKSFEQDKIPFSVALLPKTAQGQRVSPYLGVKCLVIAKHVPAATGKVILRFFEYLEKTTFSIQLAKATRYVPGFKKDAARIAALSDNILRISRKQQDAALLMPNTPAIINMWKALHAGNIRRLLTPGTDCTTFLRLLQESLKKQQARPAKKQP